MDKETYKGLPYRIKVQGVYDSDSVQVSYLPIRMPLSVDEQAYIDRVWEEGYSDTSRFRNLPKLCLSKVEVRNEELGLTLIDTDFKTYIGLLHRYRNLGGKPFRNLGVASGIESVIETADKRVIISQRSDSVNRPGWLNNVPTGFFELSHHNGDGVPSPKKTFLNELDEEVGLLVEDLEKYYVGGVAQEVEGNSQVFFMCKANLGVNEIMDRNNDGEALLFDIPRKPKVVIDIVSRFASITAGTNLGSFYLYIYHAFGTEHARRYEAKLGESLKAYRQLPNDEQEDYRKEKIEELTKLRG